MLKYIAKRYKWKYGIKYATYCFFYLNIIYIFVAEKDRYWKYITPDINNHFDSYFNCLNNNAISHTK